MKKKPRPVKRGPSRGKLAAIAVLGLLLMAVWGNALWGGGDKPDVAQRPSRRPVTRQPDVTPQGAGNPAAKRAASITVWPTMPVSQAVQNDPFGKPGWAIESRPATQESPAGGPSVTEPAGGYESQEKLVQAGAGTIVIAGEEKIATIGDREVRIGDSVGGYEVIDITSRGVVLAKDSPKR
jgi:hypothetical protein